MGSQRLCLIDVRRKTTPLPGTQDSISGPLIYLVQLGLPVKFLRLILFFSAQFGRLCVEHRVLMNDLMSVGENAKGFVGFGERVMNGPFDARSLVRNTRTEVGITMFT
jgi:hypothetical protein